MEAESAWFEREPEWFREVRKADPERRRRGREARVSLEALAHISQDPGRTRYAFEAMQNFPVLDVMRLAVPRLAVLRDPRFREIHARRSMPDFSTKAVLAMLETHAPGTLGREYARFVEGWRLHQLAACWTHLDLAEPDQYLAMRTVLLHDLIHFILGYAPFEKAGEMEVEAFLLAQTGAPNHVLFLQGYLLHMARKEPLYPLRSRLFRRLREAYRYGKRAENVMLVEWQALLDRPLEDVRRELRIDERPVVRPPEAAPEPKAPPALAHVVLNVPDLAAAEAFYRDAFGYFVAGRDERLGVTFMTDGTDHHTLALQELPGLDPRKGIRRIRSLLEGRRSGARSTEGRPTVLPTWPVLRASLRAGLNHVGYRAADEADLRAHYRRVKASGARIVWTVNHADMARGFYFRDAGGNLCEVFCDGPEAERLKAEAERAGGMRALAGEGVDVRNYEMDLDA